MSGGPTRDEVEGALARGRPEQAWDLLAREWEQGSPRARHQARRLLPGLAPRLPAAAWTSERAGLARTLGIHPPLTPARVGRLAFPVVGQGRDRFVEVVVERAPGGADDLPSLPDLETTQACQDALRAARDRTGSELGLCLRFDPPDGWAGASCGLAVALAACSCLRGLPLDPLLLATGQVEPGGRALPVGRVPEKLRLRHEARPHGRMLVADADDAHLPWVVAVADLEAAERAASLRGDLDLDGALGAVRAADRSGDWLGAARMAEALVDDPDVEDRERLTLLVLLLAAANHAADPAARARWQARLDDLLRTCSDPGEDLARALGSRLVGAVDALDLAAAEAAAALRPVEDFDPPLRVHLLGPLALLRSLQGRREEALDLRHQALQVCTSDERPRCLGDLADALLRLGRPDQALATCEQALGLVPVARRRHAYLARTAAYLGLHRARALAALGQRTEARAALAPALAVAGLDPALRARLLQAELDGSQAAAQAVADSLPPGVCASPLVRALLDRSRAALGDPAAAARLVAVPAFAGLDPAEAALRLPY